MEFENLHDHVAWLTKEFEAMKGGAAAEKPMGELESLEARVATLESRLAAADNLAKAAMAEIKHHEESTDGQSTTVDPKDGNVSG